MSNSLLEQAYAGALKENEALKAERDALVANLESLKSASRDALTYLIYPAKRSAGAMRAYNSLSMAVQETPQQCLRDVQAVAAYSGFIECYDRLSMAIAFGLELPSRKDAIECADKVRQGGEI